MQASARGNGSRTRHAHGSCDIVTAAPHEFVNGIIILPNSGQPRAKLECEFSIVASGPGLSLTPDISAPQPPGVRGGSGPLAERHVTERHSVKCVRRKLEFR